jgi:hypothetical protein
MKTGIYFLRTIQAHIQYIQFVCLHIWKWHPILSDI